MRQSTRFPLRGIASAALISALAISPALAAGPSKSRQDQPKASQENCQAAPDEKKSKENGDKTGSITKKLGNCGGVLTPPDVNDQGLVKPAPDSGEMPVIKPGQMPEQAPKQE